VQERKLAIEADRLARIAHIEDKIKESQAKVSNLLSDCFLIEITVLIEAHAHSIL
jgi:hypothetical protein